MCKVGYKEFLYFLQKVKHIITIMLVIYCCRKVFHFIFSYTNSEQNTCLYFLVFLWYREAKHPRAAYSNIKVNRQLLIITISPSFWLSFFFLQFYLLFLFNYLYFPSFFLLSFFLSSCLLFFLSFFSSWFLIHPVWKLPPQTKHRSDQG